MHQSVVEVVNPSSGVAEQTGLDGSVAKGACLAGKEKRVVRNRAREFPKAPLRREQALRSTGEDTWGIGCAIEIGVALGDQPYVIKPIEHTHPGATRSTTVRRNRLKVRLRLSKHGFLLSTFADRMYVMESVARLRGTERDETFHAIIEMLTNGSTG
jgi:hypothetical protein